MKEKVQYSVPADNDIGEFYQQLKSFLFKWHRGA